MSPRSLRSDARSHTDSVRMPSRGVAHGTSTRQAQERGFRARGLAHRAPQGFPVSPLRLQSDARSHTDSVRMASRGVAHGTSEPRPDELRGPAFALAASRPGGVR